jgi:hypothetical protein
MQHTQLRPISRTSQASKAWIAALLLIILSACTKNQSLPSRDIGFESAGDANSLIADSQPRNEAGTKDGESLDDTSISDSEVVDSGPLPPDTGFVDASTQPFIQVGTGTQNFESVHAIDELPFILGPQGGGSQGGYHLWMAVRTQGFLPEDASLTVSLLDESRTNTLVSMSRMVTLQEIGNYYGLTGIRIVPPDCCAIVGVPLVFRARVVDRSGIEDTSDVSFIGGDRCPDIDDQNICP